MKKSIEWMEKIRADAVVDLKDPQIFYTREYVNYKEEGVTEIVAIVVLEHFDEFCDGIKQIDRAKGYYTPSHDGKKEGINSESNVERKLFNMCNREGITFESIGKILDYQTPLQSKKSDPSKAFDLLSYHDSKNTLYMIELKSPSASDSLLHCILEVFTYWKIVNKEKLITDFQSQFTQIKYEAVVKPSVLIFEHSRAYEDYYDNNAIKVRELMQKMGVSVFSITQDKPYQISILQC